MADDHDADILSTAHHLLEEAAREVEQALARLREPEPLSDDDLYAVAECLQRARERLTTILRSADQSS